jgi:hypothetical protein
MRARAGVAFGIVLLASAIALVQAALNRRESRRETTLSDREAPIARGGRDESALWMHLEYATPVDSSWGGWLGNARLAALGADTTREALRRRQMDARPSFAVLELGGPLWRDHVEARVVEQARALAADSVPARRDSLVLRYRRSLEGGSRLILVDAGPDAEALAAAYPDAARHLILPAVVRTFATYRFTGPGAATDTVLGSRVDLEARRLLVSGAAARAFHLPRSGGYRVTVATGRSHAPWVKSVEPERVAPLSGARGPGSAARSRDRGSP